MWEHLGVTRGPFLEGPVINYWARKAAICLHLRSRFQLIWRYCDLHSRFPTVLTVSVRPLSLQCRYLQGLKAVFVYIQDRGFNGVADNTSLSARTRAFIQSLDFDLNIWFRSRKVTRMRLRETGPRRTPSPRSRYTVESWCNGVFALPISLYAG